MFILFPHSFMHRTSLTKTTLNKGILRGREWTSLTKTTLYKDILKSREWTSLTKTTLNKDILRGRERTSLTKTTLYIMYRRIYRQGVDITY